MSLSKEIRKLVGKKITKVMLNAIYDHDAQKWIYDPSIYLDNGMVLMFIAQESEMGIYGVEPIIGGLAPSKKKENEDAQG